MHSICLFVLAGGGQVVDANDGRLYLWIAIGVGLVALALAFALARAVIASDTGTAEMQAISNAIREGAEAFLKRQYQTIGMIALVLAVVVFVGYQHVAADGAVCGEDGDQLPGGCGVLGAGGVYGDVLLDPGEHPDGVGGADELESGAADWRCAAAR